MGEEMSHDPVFNEVYCSISLWEQRTERPTGDGQRSRTRGGQRAGRQGGLEEGRRHTLCRDLARVEHCPVSAPRIPFTLSAPTGAGLISGSSALLYKRARAALCRG